MVLVAAALLLGACAETQLVTHAAKKLGAGEAPPKVKGYKVGSPYQVEGIWYYPREDYDYDETGIASWYGPNFHGKLTANGEVYDQNDVTAAHKTLPMPSFVRVTNLENGRSLVVRVNDRGPFVNGRIIDLSRRSAQLLGVFQNGTAKVRVQIMAEESRAIATGLQNQSLAADGGSPIQAAAMPKEAVSAEALAPPPGGKGTSGGVMETKPVQVAAKSADKVVLPNPVSENVTMVPVSPTRIYIQAGSFSTYEAAHKVAARLSSVGSVNVYPALVNGRDVYRVRVGPANSVEDGDRMLKAIAGSGFQDARIVLDRPDAKTLSGR
ncbi:MAG: septal ring lytic transglycosylase RlpA family protein [Magnetospirillum sp. WYHS-4]